MVAASESSSSKVVVDRMRFHVRGMVVRMVCVGLATIVPGYGQDAFSPYTVETFIGIDSQAFADGSAERARFGAPRDAAIDRAGNIYVADPHNHVIRKITPRGGVSTLAGVPGDAGDADGSWTARFNNPQGVAVDAEGNVYVSDRGNLRIRKINPDGVARTLAGSGRSGSADGSGREAEFSDPWGLAVDREGNVFVAEVSDRRIRKITPDGRVTTFVRSDNPAFSPSDVAFDSEGNLLVSDRSDAIHKVSPSGVVSIFASHFQLRAPTGIAIDSANLVYVTAGNRVLRVAPNGGVTVVAGGEPNSTVATLGNFDGPAALARFNVPWGLAVAPNGSIYVTDWGNRTIRVIAPNGVVSTHAGVGKQAGPADGPRDRANLYFPVGLAIDGAGALYVADYAHNSIRKVVGNSVVTLAGSAELTGYLDATGPAARFNQPSRIAVDPSGNVFVTEASHHAIRKITPAGVVTTFAGNPNAVGTSDGQGASARFSRPTSLAVDSVGNVFVSDSRNRTIRKITPGGLVSTLAGSPDAPFFSTDGLGAAARFSDPGPIVVEPTGDLLVADNGIRRITPEGNVSTIPGVTGVQLLARDPAGNLFFTDRSSIRRLNPAGRSALVAGSALSEGHMDGVGADVRFRGIGDIVADRAGALYISDGRNNAIRRAASAPGILMQPQPARVRAGGPAFFFTRVAGPIDGAQWFKNGDPIAGATAVRLDISNAAVADAGAYFCEITRAGIRLQSAPARLSVGGAARLANLSVRSTIPALGAPLIVGFVAGGGARSSAEPLLVRAVGPSLAQFGLQGIVADTVVKIYDGATKVQENDDWGGGEALASAAARVGAFPLAGPSSKDAAVLLSDVRAGSLSAHVTDNVAAGGIALAEVYDTSEQAALDPNGPRLINMSSRVTVNAGAGELFIAGFVVIGPAPVSVLIRAVGPGLAQFGVTDFLPNPTLELFRGSTRIDANDNWSSFDLTLAAATESVGAFRLPAGSADAALFVTLEPGSYTAQVSALARGIGQILVEVYEVR